MKKDYFNYDLFYTEITKFQNEMKNPQLSGDAVISDCLGTAMIQLVDEVIKNNNFRNYPDTVKEDMKSFALQKCMLGIHKFNLDYGKEKLFGYFTRCVYLAFLTIISKYYKEKNGKWKYAYNQLSQYGLSDEKIKSIIGPDYSNGTGQQKENIFNNANISLRKNKK